MQTVPSPLLGSLAFLLLGYISGSVLYARVFSRLFKAGDFIAESKDRNPGTANAFAHGGFLCGVMTLAGDLLKGALPVCLFIRFLAARRIPVMLEAAVLASPVIGHVFPVFFDFHGGKGIATTFGCLLGLAPELLPLLLLAVFFLFFSLILCIHPHTVRTLFSYFFTMLFLYHSPVRSAIRLGFIFISLAVGFRLFTSPEPKERTRMTLLWKH